MPNWQASTDTAVMITAADNNILYGINALGEAMQTNENLQTSWQPIGNVIGSIRGKGNDGTLYGIDSRQNAFQYDGKVSPLFTDGLNPASLGVDARTSQLWMTTGTPGDDGNIFTRSQRPDYSTIMTTITPLDKTRDDVAKQVETEFAQETDVMTLNKQVGDVITYFKKMFNLDKHTGKQAHAQVGKITQDIQEPQVQLDIIENATPYIIGSIGLLILVALVYMIGSTMIGWYVHLIALVVFGVGMFLIVNFSGTIKQWLRLAT
jgi:hypothetical protein